MRRWCFVLTVAFAFACYLFAAVALEFNSSKRYDRLKTTDKVVGLQCLVTTEGAARPILPADIKELGKQQHVVYDAPTRSWITSCVVMMVIPAEHEAELAKRLAAYSSEQVKKLTDQEVADLTGQYPELQSAAIAMNDRVVYALTPPAIPAPER